VFDSEKSNSAENKSMKVT